MGQYLDSGIVIAKEMLGHGGLRAGQTHLAVNGFQFPVNVFDPLQHALSGFCLKSLRCGQTRALKGSV
jgi:hypothetical protein